MFRLCIHTQIIELLINIKILDMVIANLHIPLLIFLGSWDISHLICNKIIKIELQNLKVLLKSSILQDLFNGNNTFPGSRWISVCSLYINSPKKFNIRLLLKWNSCKCATILPFNKGQAVSWLSLGIVSWLLKGYINIKVYEVSQETFFLNIWPHYFYLLPETITHYVE